MWLGELLQLFRRRRIQALLAACAAVPIGVALAVRLSGGPGDGEGPAFLNQVTNSGVFAALAGLGTLRYLLVRPCGRTRLLVAKGVSIAMFCLTLALVVAAAGLAAGVALF